MRLLKTTKSNVGAFEIEEFADDQLQNQPYAILSHTWGSDEVTLQNINEPIIKSRVGYRKVEQCCSIAHEMGAELSEAINSMFLWYQEATICYAYLFDVPQEPFERSRWFTRGWTLQELIAPREMVFYDGNWKKLGDKASLGTRISRCTRIPESILLGDQDLDTFSIAQRMSWAAERQTSRVEDRAYCLMGLFGVNMPLIYGEREGAFIRLQEEILRISEDHSLFAWKSSDTRAGLLATSPAAFIDSYDIVPHDTIIGETSDTFYSPLIISGKGIHLDLCQIGLEHVGLGLAVLQCKKVDGGSTAVAIFVHDPSLTLERFKRVYCGNFHHLDLKRFNKSQLRMTRMCIQAGRMTRLQRIGSSEEYNMSLPINIYPIATLARALNWNHPQVDVHVWLMLTQSRPESSLNKVYSGRTPLSWAAENGLENYARSLLKRGAGTEVNDKLFHSPLCWASLNGHTAVVKLLLDKGASTKAAGPDGRTPLMHCSYAGHEDIASVLIDTGADINAEDRYGDVPLIHAILADNVSIVKILIAKGADINIKGVGGRIPLIHAILADNVSIVKILIDKGADINVKCANGRVPLIYAVLAHNVSIVKILIDKGADINGKCINGRVPLIYAVLANNVSIVKILIAKGADINGKCVNGHAPLVYAIDGNSISAMMALIDMGADINIKSNNGQSPLVHALLGKKESIAKILIHRRADVNAKDGHGKTPLMTAIRVAAMLSSNRAKIVRIVERLVQEGADINAKDESGETPLSIAQDEELQEVVNLLLAKGATVGTKHQTLMARLARKS